MASTSLASGLAQPRPQHGSLPVSARGEVGLDTLAHFACAAGIRLTHLAITSG